MKKSKENKRILIANRGEIADRIAKTVKKMGHTPLFVYAHPDRNLTYIKNTSEKFLLQGDTVIETYLSKDKIIEAAKYLKADAVHPGYGFLSEDKVFAQLILDNNFIFIGPSPDSMNILGDKINAKKLAEKLNVPTAKWFAKENVTTAELTNEIKVFAEKNNFPLILKASAGGGGKGMRIINSIEEIAPMVEAATREAGSSFKDSTTYVETLFDNARHIEIQILSDKHKNIVHLFERDCSLQRNNQKIIEEAPALNLDPKIKESLYAWSIALAKEANYQGLGTFEYLVKDKSAIFLECNTRLQVEHTVTEEITGLDLVQLQIEVAFDKTLPEILPDKISCLGHAIQVRLCAEDPALNFSPSVGRIETLLFDTVLFDTVHFNTVKNIRIDTAYKTNDFISPFYDSLIAKVIVHESSRENCIKNLITYLNNSEIHGIKTNIELLIKLLKLESFINISHTTGLLTKDFLTTLLGSTINNKPARFPVLNKKNILKNISNALQEILSPLPGRISFINNNKTIKKSDLLFTVDSMKMEHRVTAESNGEIIELKVSLNDIVQADQIIFALKIL